MAFTKITIDRFRGIKHCEIDNLGKRVNLFVGRNNCGKTSVLDAVFLLGGMSNPLLFAQINLFRECSSKNFSDAVDLNFYALSTEDTIHINGQEINSENRRLKIKAIYEDKPVSKDEILLNKPTRIISQLEYTFYKENSNNPIEETLFLEEDKKYKEERITNEIRAHVPFPPKAYKEDVMIVYLHAKVVPEAGINNLGQMLENKQKEIILYSLQEVEPKIKDITIIGDRIMVDIGLPKLLPIQVLGDGIRKILAVILCLYRATNGILLIDEIDNGLHYTSMPTLWKTILSAAEKFNVQVFATTHNIDSLKALKEVLETKGFENEQKNTTVFRLRRTDEDELIAYPYDYEKLEYAIEMEHEIR